MRKLAAYSAQAEIESPETLQERLDHVRSPMDSSLDSKGEVRLDDGVGSVIDTCRRRWRYTSG